MVGVSVNIKYSYHVINVKQYLRTPVQRAIRTGGVGGHGPLPVLGKSVNPISTRGQIMPTTMLVDPLPGFA